MAGFAQHPTGSSGAARRSEVVRYRASDLNGRPKCMASRLGVGMPVVEAITMPSTARGLSIGVVEQVAGGAVDSASALSMQSRLRSAK